MRILSIDAGNIESGFVLLEVDNTFSSKPTILNFGKVKNEELQQLIRDLDCSDLYVALEMIASYGMAVGKSVFDTCVWIGRFYQQLDTKGAREIEYVYRKDEKMCLCNSMKAKDSNIRQALIDIYAESDFKNGKGTKKQPDYFYGFAKDMWAAMAVAHVYLNKLEEKMK